MKLTTFNNYVVEVDDCGQFSFTLPNGEKKESESFAKLCAVIEKHPVAKQKRVAIPAFTLPRYGEQEGVPQPITITGVHSGTNNLLYVDAEGKKGQISQGYGDSSYILSESDLYEHALLLQACKDAKAAMSKFLRPREADRSTVESALLNY